MEIPTEINENKEDIDLNLPLGTRDFQPDQMALREEIIGQISKIFKKYGGVPIDTPVFELRKILMGKYGENNKLVFDLLDQGGQLLSMRYDLTVPFARFMAKYNLSNLKKYQIGKVYRRDNPSPEQGRYREFYQCDFDIAGKYDLMIPDSEILTILSEILSSTLSPYQLDYKIKINNINLLFNILLYCGVTEDKLKTVCSSIDKLDKKSWEEIKSELIEKQISEQSIDMMSQYININGNLDQVINSLYQSFKNESNIIETLNQMNVLVGYLNILTDTTKIAFDLSLARGLDYYTGLIFEAVITNSSIKVGSIAAGGRYDNLINMFKKGKQVNDQIPAVGLSIGLERIFTLIESNNRLSKNSSKTVCLVTSVGSGLIKEVMKICRILRQSNISTQFNYLETPRMQDQLAIALKNEIPYLVIIGQKELNNGTVQVKDLNNKIQKEVPMNDLVEYIKQLQQIE